MPDIKAGTRALNGSQPLPDNATAFSDVTPDQCLRLKEAWGVAFEKAVTLQRGPTIPVGFFGKPSLTALRKVCRSQGINGRNFYT
jgi:L-ascorbate metabolism protein UlaG (beta-lactamase superfamily)